MNGNGRRLFGKQVRGGSCRSGAAGVSVVEFDRRGKAARATRALVDTVREAAGFPRE